MRHRSPAATVALLDDQALSSADVDAGYVLTCQSRPTTPSVRVDYDA